MIKLHEFVDKLNSITDPSRSEFERRMKGNHRIVTTGYPDPWGDMPDHGAGIEKATRLADYKNGEDEEVYESVVKKPTRKSEIFTEAFKAGTLNLRDKSTYSLTESEANLLNSVFVESGMTESRKAEVYDGLVKSKEKLKAALAFAKTVK